MQNLMYFHTDLCISSFLFVFAKHFSLSFSCLLRCLDRVMVRGHNPWISVQLCVCQVHCNLLLTVYLGCTTSSALFLQ